MEQVHIERLRTLYSIMAGIPSRIVFMDQWRKMAPKNSDIDLDYRDQTLISRSIDKLVVHDMNDKPHCGTAACALGWASAYPDFRAAGLIANEYGTPEFKGLNDYNAGSAFFGISYDESSFLFRSTMREARTISHKQLFLNRLRHLLVKKNIITQERSNELQKEEFEREIVQANATFVVHVN